MGRIGGGHGYLYWWQSWRNEKQNTDEWLGFCDSALHTVGDQIWTWYNTDFWSDRVTILRGDQQGWSSTLRRSSFKSEGKKPAIWFGGRKITWYKYKVGRDGNTELQRCVGDSRYDFRSSGPRTTVSKHRVFARENLDWCLFAKRAGKSVCWCWVPCVWCWLTLF